MWLLYVSMSRSAAAASWSEPWHAVSVAARGPGDNVTAVAMSAALLRVVVVHRRRYVKVRDSINAAALAGVSQRSRPMHGMYTSHAAA